MATYSNIAAANAYEKRAEQDRNMARQSRNMTARFGGRGTMRAGKRR